jgi:sugar phosphate permease
MTEQDRKRTVWRWRVFAATWLSYAGLYFARKPFSIVKADVEQTFGWGPEELGLLGGLYLIAYTIGQFTSGALGQKWGPRVVLLSGMALSVGANAALGFSNSFGTFGVLLFLNGLAQSTGWSNNVGTMGQWFRREERGRVMGIWATNYQVGGVLANVLAAYVAGAMGFRWSFFAGSVVLTAVWIFVFFNQRNKPEDVGLEPIDDPEQDAVDQVAKSEKRVTWPREIVVNIAIVGAFYFFVKFIRYALWSWAPYLLKTELGLQTDEAGYLSTVFDLAGVAGVIICGWMSDKLFDNRRASVALIFILGMAASCALLYTVGTTGAVMFATSLGLIGFTLYGPDALMTGAGAIDVGSARRATMAAGVINGMGSIGSVMQEFVLGAVLEEGSSSTVFAILLAAAISAALMLGILLIRRRRGLASL